MSHQLPALNEFKNQIKLAKNFHYDQPYDPSIVLSSPAIQLDFEPVQLIKLCLLLLVSLLIPLLSLHSPSFSLLGFRRTNAHRHSHRHRNSRRRLPVNYEPPQSVVDAPFVPIPTRRHFRLSHIGNRNLRRAPTNVVYTNHSSSDSEDCQSESGHRSDREPVQNFRLVFGKRLRGEEEEFRGRSAMKGARPSQSSSLTISPTSTHSSAAESTSQAGLTNTKTNAVSTRVISFAATRVCPHTTTLASIQV